LPEEVFEKDPNLVEIRAFIYPRFDEGIYKELVENGITHAYSFGGVQYGKLKVLGKGKTGVVVLLDRDKAVKIKRADSPKEGLELEARIQEMAYPSSPKVYLYGRNFIVMEYVRGRTLTPKDFGVLPDLLARARYLEEVKIEHLELSRPWRNVLVTGERTYIIDYDSSQVKENPNNVTKVLSAFKLYELAREYKKGRDLRKVLSTLTELLPSSSRRSLFPA
jgi:putative serine/threonine protein kinase